MNTKKFKTCLTKENYSYNNLIYILILLILTLFLQIFISSIVLADDKKDLQTFDNYSDFDITVKEFIRKVSLHPEEFFLAQYNPRYNRQTKIITEYDLFDMLSSSDLREFIVHLGYSSSYLYPSYVIRNIRDLIKKHDYNSIHLVYLSSYTKIDENFSSMFIQALHGSNPPSSERFVGIITKKQLDSLTDDVHTKVFSLFDNIVVLDREESNTLHYSTLEKAIEVAAANPNNLSTTVYLKEGSRQELAGIINSLVRLAYSDYTLYHNVNYILQTGFFPRDTIDIEPMKAASMLGANLDKISNITESANFTIRYHEEPSRFSLLSRIVNDELYLPINANANLQKSSLINRLLRFNLPEFKEIELDLNKDSSILRNITTKLNSGTYHYDNENPRYITGSDSGLFISRIQDSTQHKLHVQLIFSKVVESWMIFANKYPITLNVNGVTYNLPYANVKEISSDFLSITTVLDISSLGIDPSENLRVNVVLNFISSGNNASKLFIKFVLTNQTPVLKVHKDIVNYLINRAFYFRLLEIKDQIFVDNEYNNASVFANVERNNSYVYNLKYNLNIKFPVRVKNKVFHDRQRLEQYLTTSISYLYGETRSLIDVINNKINNNSTVSTNNLELFKEKDCSDFFTEE